MSTPAPGHAEQDPELWWHAAQAALGAIWRGQDPAGIGLAGQMHGLVLLDDGLRPLRPAILWNDQRTAAECDEIEQLVGLERLIALTGNRALTGFTAPKLLWVRRHEPDVYRRIAHVLLPKDYVRLRLTGELATDVSDASGTLLFDVGGRCWSEEMLDLLDLPREWFPAALESGAVSGATAGGVPVAAGGGDQAAGALGVGVDRPGSVSVALGTSGVVFGVLPALAADPRGTAHTFCHAVPGTWHAMGVMLAAGGSLDWLHGSVVPGVPIEALLDAAAVWEPGCEGLQFAPYLSGERTPHADPAVRGAFVGLTLRHDTGALDAGRARGRRLWPSRLARAPPRARPSPVGRPNRRRRQPQRAVAADRCVGARPAARGHRGRRRGGARRSDARRRRSRVVRRRAPRRSSRASASSAASTPSPPGASAYADGYAAFRRLYPAIASLRAAGA